MSGGAGTVGGFAVSLAKWGGARVIATVGSEEQAELVLEAGADHALNYRTDDVAARVEEITDGSGAERIVEVAFGRNLALDTKAIAPLGTIAAYSSDADAEPRLPFWELLFKNVVIRLVGSDDLPGRRTESGGRHHGVPGGRGAPPAYRPAHAARTHRGGPRGGRGGRSTVGSYWTSTSEA